MNAKEFGSQFEIKGGNRLMDTNKLNLKLK